MKNEMMNVLLFVGICFILYIIYVSIKSCRRDGMTNRDSSDDSTSGNGIAGNASAYAATIKSATIKSQDVLLISKYRSEYETVILNLEDFINNAMLKTALTIDPDKPGPAFETLATMQQAKSALDGIMKFVDSSK